MAGETTTDPATPRASELGGKAANLFELERAGFRIPETYCEPDDVAAIVARLGPPIAVRSSATCEDGRFSSFAGQFESYLHLATLAQVEEAIEKCRRSVQAESVKEYCRKSGVPHEDVKMNVIVQRMIQPELAGVVFTVNPVTGVEEIVIEAVAGVAEDLLAGKAESLPADHPLIAKWRPAIEELARRVQRHFGCPQDLEFAIEGGELYLLQSRPITRITFGADIGEWTNADFRDGGVSSTVCTPLMWSLYDFIWEDALKGYLRQLKLLGTDEDFQAGRMFFGRPYWNMGAVKRCLAKLPGFVEREFDKDLSVEATYEGDGIVTPMTLGGIIRVLPTAFAIGGIYNQQESLDRAFLAGGYERLEARYATIPDGELGPAFEKLIEDAYCYTETNYFRTIYCASIAKLEFTDAFPDADYTQLVAALPPLRHMEPIKALREMAAGGEKDVAPIIERFGHHSRKELDIRVPRWDEDREFVEQLLESFGAGSHEGDPKPAYEKARAEARGRLPWWKRGKFDRKLDNLRKFVWLREEMRDLSSRMYALIRRWVVEIMKRRALGDDVWFMTWQEIVRDDRSNVARAREVYESYRNFRAPNEVGARYGAAAAAEGALRGIGASQGEARGIARVARSVEETARIEKGAILICPFTDPGWTPVLDRVAGVVTETGGLLSHAAVICREYGIPAVLALPNATERIRDGQTVVLRGGEGLVELVD